MPTSKNNDLRYVEIVAKKKSFVPPPGNYNNIDKA